MFPGVDHKGKTKRYVKAYNIESSSTGQVETKEKEKKGVLGQGVDTWN